MFRQLLVAFLFFFLAVLPCAAETLSTGEDVEEFVQNKIDTHQVMVFAKSYCPYCKRTRALMMEMEEYINVNVEYVNLDELPADDGPKIQAQLAVLTGQRTVPNVFIGQNHVGGNSDLQQLHAVGKLEVMLLEASDGPEL